MEQSKKSKLRSILVSVSMIAFIISLLLLFNYSVSHAQLNENCTVRVLNRTANVQPDGTFTLPNVPSNMGQVRARATCVENGITRSGQSDFFTVVQNGVTDVGEIRFETVDPVPAAIAVSADPPP